MREFRLPDLGEGVTEGEIVRIFVAEGEHVAEDQPLIEVETDKAAVEIPSPFEGLVTRLHVAEKQVVNVGDVMVTFDDGDGEPAAVEVKPSATAAATKTTAAAPRRVSGATKPASPAVRKLARELGVGLDSIAGSGPGGRVTRDDVRKAATGPAPSAPKPAAAPVDDAWGPTRREPISRARRAIADAMARSVSTIAHVTDTDDADITDLDRLRRDYTSPDQADRKLTILAFVIRATALTLKGHPVFNASFDADAGEIIYHDYVSIAMGVHTDRGLIAPVIRNVDTMSIPQIADELTVLADKARTASFEVNDTRGGTFTISNAGAMGGSRYSTPIINYPQAAVLALGRSRWQPWVVDNHGRQILPRLILPLSLSFDHRMIDGAQEVVFMQQIIGLLHRPATLML